MDRLPGPVVMTILGGDVVPEALFFLRFILVLVIIDFGFVQDEIVVMTALLLDGLGIFPSFGLLF